MGHSHAHDHHHPAHSSSVQLTRAFTIGIGLNAGFVLVEFLAGLRYDSLALIADAGHNLSDVAGLLLALFAFRLAKVKSSQTFTYGYKKSTVLISLLNAIILLVAVGGIVIESIHRFENREIADGQTVAIIAGVGIVINSFSALLFFREKDKDINIRGAYLHLVADALVSLGVVVGGLIIVYTGWWWVDPVISIIIALVILLSTWGLLKESLILSLDGKPSGLKTEQIKKEILAVDGVTDVHHIHIWAISTTENAFTAHLVVHEAISRNETQRIKDEVKHILEHRNITHVTLETEVPGQICMNDEC